MMLRRVLCPSTDPDATLGLIGVLIKEKLRAPFTRALLEDPIFLHFRTTPPSLRSRMTTGSRDQRWNCHAGIKRGTIVNQICQHKALNGFYFGSQPIKDIAACSILKGNIRSFLQLNSAATWSEAKKRGDTFWVWQPTLLT